MASVASSEDSAVAAVAPDTAAAASYANFTSVERVANYTFVSALAAGLDSLLRSAKEFSPLVQSTADSVAAAAQPYVASALSALDSSPLAAAADTLGNKSLDAAEKVGEGVQKQLSSLQQRGAQTVKGAVSPDLVAFCGQQLEAAQQKLAEAQRTLTQGLAQGLAQSTDGAQALKRIVLEQKYREKIDELVRSALEHLHAAVSRLQQWPVPPLPASVVAHLPAAIAGALPTTPVTPGDAIAAATARLSALLGSLAPTASIGQAAEDAKTRAVSSWNDLMQYTPEAIEAMLKHLSDSVQQAKAALAEFVKRAAPSETAATDATAATVADDATAANAADASTQ